MARLPSSPFGPTPVSVAKKDPILDLSRQLSRLEQTILRASAEQERRLRRDEFERIKVRYDLDVARNALTRLEQEALGTKIHSRRHEVQADLNRKRELLDGLFERVRDLEEMGVREEEDNDGDSSEGEDVLAGIIPTPSESVESRSIEGAGASEDVEGGQGLKPVSESSAKTKEKMDDSPPEMMLPQEPDTTITSQDIRSRSKHPDPTTQPATTASPDVPSAHSTSAARASLFGTASTDLTATATEEAILDRHREEQEALTGDILRLAGALKKSASATSRLLEEDKAVLGRVGENLDTTDRGMEAAGRRMGALTRMTEGKGWWGRMLLFGMVYGMMAVLVLTFLFLPKLRF